MNDSNVYMVMIPVRGLMLSVRVVYVTMNLREQQMYLYVLMASLPAASCLLPPAAASTTATAFTSTFLLLTLQLTAISEPPVPSEGG